MSSSQEFEFGDTSAASEDALDISINTDVPDDGLVVVVLKNLPEKLVNCIRHVCF